MNSKKVVTGQVRLSYVNIFEARATYGDKAKYSLSIIIPKSDEKTIKEIKQAISSAEKMGRKKFGLVESKKLRTPLRDGDVEKSGNPVYKNNFFILVKK